MSKRKNGTFHAADALGLNPYGWGNGRARKRPREVRTPIGQTTKYKHLYYKGEWEKIQDGKSKK